MTHSTMNLVPDEVRVLFEDGSLTIDRPIKLREFQRSDTLGYDFIFRDRRALWNDFTVSDLLTSKFCPYRIGMTVHVREPFYVPHDSDSDGYSSWDCGPLSLDSSSLQIQYVALPEYLDPPKTDHSIESCTEPQGPGDWWLAPPNHWDGNSDYYTDPNATWIFLPWGTYTKYSAAQMPIGLSRLIARIEDISIVDVEGKWYWRYVLKTAD